jgi:hypothetical protein
MPGNPHKYHAAHTRVHKLRHHDVFPADKLTLGGYRVDTVREVAPFFTRYSALFQNVAVVKRTIVVGPPVPTITSPSPEQGGGSGWWEEFQGYSILSDEGCKIFGRGDPSTVRLFGCASVLHEMKTFRSGWCNVELTVWVG